jgi:hypothetical protein
MIRFLVRAMGYLCLAGAFVGLVIDGTRSIASGVLTYARLGDVAGGLDPALQARLATRVPGWALTGLRDYAGPALQMLPLTTVLLALAIVLLWLGASGEPQVGIRTR